MGVYCLDLVTPGTYLHNTMDKTDIVHALYQYVEKLNIVLKTFKKTTKIGCVFFLELNVYIHEDVPGVTFVVCGVTSCQWCYLM